MSSSEMLRSVALVRNDVLEEPSVSIIKTAPILVTLIMEADTDRVAATSRHVCVVFL
jgi:hypothetical protein